jgi:hypothetical protein
MMFVEILALPQTDSTRQNAFRFQRFYYGRKCRVLVHVDDPWHGIARWLRAVRKKRLAAAVSCLAVSKNSIVWPVESTARYRYLS